MAKIRDDEGMYEMVCKPNFNEIKESQKEIIGLLRGKNGDPGLLDDVRTLKARWKVIYGTAAIAGVAALKAVIAWITEVI